MSGQAQIELIAAVPAILAAAVVCMQLLAAGLSLTLVDGAAEAGALALAGGGDAELAVRDALPEVGSGRVEIEVAAGRVEVRLQPRSLIPGAGAALEVSSTARVREAGAAW